MVAKLKTSFLKSGFQLFCHKHLFATQDQVTNRPIDDDNQSTRIKSSVQFSSSPNLSTAPTDDKSVIPQKSIQDTHQDSSITKGSQNRSLSAGRTESEALIKESPTRTRQNGCKHDEITNSQHNEVKPAKKIPKYLAKSKLNNQLNDHRNSAISQNLNDISSEPKKQRSKSSGSLNRDEFNENNNDIFIEPEVELDPKFYRHSFPNPIIENLPVHRINSNNGSFQVMKRNGITNQDFIIVNEEEHELPPTHQISNALYKTDNVNRNSAGNLYKNNESIANLKLAKRIQIMNRNTNNHFHSEFDTGVQNQYPQNNNYNNIPGQNSKNEESDLRDVKKPIVFNHKNALINGSHKQSGEQTSSILSKQSKLSKSSNLDENGMKLEKKAVRFADSLGLELESIITLNQMDSNPHRRRIVRINHSNPSHNHFANQNSQAYHRGHLAYATNNNNYNQHDRYNFAKTYNGKLNYHQNQANITHFNNEKVLRQQEHEARKYLVSSKNHFEDPNNGTCLYDDIISKASFGDDNKYRYVNEAGKSYEFELSGNNQPSRIYVNGSGDKGLNEPNMNRNGGGNLHYFMVNNDQSRAGYESSNNAKTFRNVNEFYKHSNSSNGNIHEMVKSKNSTNGNGPNAQPKNITITTRINNGKLESEV